VTALKPDYNNLFPIKDFDLPRAAQRELGKKIAALDIDDLAARYGMSSEEKKNFIERRDYMADWLDRGMVQTKFKGYNSVRAFFGKPWATEGGWEA